MNKYIIFSALAALVAVFLCSCPPKEKPWKNNEVSAGYPAGTVAEDASSLPPTAEIYIDASGSMKPYFEADGTGMINTISDIHNLNTDGTTIYFIGNKTPFSGLVANIIKDVKKQPNNATSEFQDFFKDVTAKLDTVNTVVYLVTDGIMSVSAGDTKNALRQLKGLIRSSLSGHPNLAGGILRYTSDYKGDYWNSKNQRLSGKQAPQLADVMKRPYYVIVLGEKGAVRRLASLPAKDLNNPKVLWMGIHDLAGHQRAALSYADVRKLEDNSKPVTLILELPACLKDANPSKVVLTAKGNTLDKATVTNNQGRMTAVIPTNQVVMLDDGQYRVTISAPNDIPAEWLNAWTTDDDIAGPDEDTTFGLSYLVEGMFEALETAGSPDTPLFSAEFVYLPQ